MTKSSDASCRKGLPYGSPENAAADAVRRGDVRLFRYDQNGESWQQFVAGYEGCTGDGLAVPGHSPTANPTAIWSEEDYKRDTLKLGDIRDKSRPLDCLDCDYPLSACGEIRVAYAGRYNHELYRLKARKPKPSCVMEHPEAIKKVSK